MRNGLIRLSTAALCVAACFGAAHAAPTSPKVVAGQASFSQEGNVFSITNTPGTIINWQSFSVNAGEITRFIQQSGDSAVLNRIVGQDPSRILGALQSNGKVFLINPNGVVFGRDAKVDVGGLVASTLHLSDADFLAGKKNFAAGANAGALRNEGAITTPGGGKVFLVAPTIENSGIISAPNGEVVLAAGRSVQLVDAGNPDLSVTVSAPSDQAVNLGQVVSQGGRIGIYGALVNQRGVVNADSAVVGRNGRIVLKASKETVLGQGSLTSAQGAGKGGEIQLLGERVALEGNARVDASGLAGGGTVLAGGDYQGRNAALPNAQQTSFGKDAAIRADALALGNGGKVVLWSDGATAAHGSISARGAGSGAGGLVETSGRRLAMDGIRVDAGAGQGARAGTWLIDPVNLVVSDGAGDADTTYVTANTLTATNADIVLQASNNLSILQDIATAHSVRAEAGNDLTVGAAVTSTNGSIDLRAGRRLTLAAGGLLASPNYIDLKAERMTLTGNIDGVDGVLPIVSFNPFNNATEIDVRASEAARNALYLNPNRLGAFNAYEINIGNSGQTGGVIISNALSMTGNLVIDTAYTLNVNAPVALTGAASQFVGTVHAPSGTAAMVSNAGSIDAAKRISILGADRLEIYSTLKAGDIDLSAASGGITLHRNPTGGTSTTTSLEANNTLTMRTEGAVYQEGNAQIKAPSLLVEAGSVQMLGANQVGTLAGKATGMAGAGGFTFRYSGDLNIGTVAGVSGLRSPNELSLTGGALSVDAGIDGRAVLIDADSIGGNGIVKGDVLSLRSRGGIGATGSPLRTSAKIVTATNTASGRAPINILNDRALTLGDVVQDGSGNSGAIMIETNGGLTVGSTATGQQGVRTESGDISLITHSPMNIEGKVSTESGNISLIADNDGPLTVGAAGQVASASGSVRLTGGEVKYPSGSVVVSSPDKLSVTVTAPDPGQNPGQNPGQSPTLAICLANPDAPGCGSVMEQATRDCFATPESAQCRQVLPQPQSCRNDPSKLGCAVVLVRECIATPKAPACQAVLPAYAVCEQTPATYGCVPVIAQYQAVERCIATPKAPSCIGVLPVYETCAATPSAHGCGPVIAERKAIAACIADPKAPGCGDTLPPLDTCRADANVYGCVPVIERAEFLACVANPTAGGCSQRLPALSVCKLAPGVEGCEQVRQVAFDACLASPHDASCAGILPTLSQCVDNKATAGCQAVLPTLQQCIGSPTLQGCSVQLPKLEQCATNPGLAGCEAVLPKPDFCSTHPSDPKCAVFNPNPAQGGGESKKPVAEAQQITVTLLNARTRDGGKPATRGGEGEADKKPSEQSEKQSGPAPGTNPGVKNEKPATKMYCN